MIKAKSDGESLFIHTKKVIKEAAKRIDTIEKNNRGLITDELKKAVLITCAYHDLGKADKRFPDADFSHALISSHIANESLEENEYKDLIIFSILGHHGSRSKRSFCDKTSQKAFLREKELIEEYNSIKLFIKDFDINLPNLIIPEESFLKTYLRIKKNIRRGKWKEYLIIQGILNYSDWIASSGYKQKFKKIKPKDIKLREFQKKASNGKDTIIITPTGRGKTLAALKWWESTKRNKLNFLLPTITTTEAAFENIMKDYGENTGIIHGNQYYYLNVNQDILSNQKTNRFWMKKFDFPISISTYDQLLLAMLNWGRWEIKISNILDSAIVFDEIHFSEPYTLGIIFDQIKRLKELNIPICIMSATIPEYILNELKNILDDPVLVKDEEGFKESKVEINKISRKDIQNLVESEYSKNKKIIITCNTVKKAQEMYGELEKRIGKNVLLYHGRFNNKDHYKKLKILTSSNPPQILVATQIIEISLDINYDVLITEAAPIDSLIQRMGRVNRYNKSIGKVYIFPQEENSKRIYDSEIVKESVEKILEIKKPSSGDLYGLCNEVLKNKNEKIQKELLSGKDKSEYIKDVTREIFTLGKEDRYSDDLIRKNTFKQISIVPIEYKECKLMEKLDNQLKIPIRKEYIDSMTNDEEGFLFLPVEYSYKLGFIGMKEEKNIL